MVTGLQAFAQIPLDSVAIRFRQDTTITLNSPRLRVRLTITNSEAIGTVYELAIMHNDSSTPSIRDTAWDYWGPAYFEFVDLTFDGFVDFRIPVDAGPDNWVYHTYIYSPNRRTFVPCETCRWLMGDITLYPKSKKIKATGYDYHYSASDYWERYFKIRNGFPSMSKTRKETFKMEYPEMDSTHKREKK